MTEFQELKEKQLSYLDDVRKFKTIVSDMGKSGVDLLEKSLNNASYLIDADGLAKQLQNPNISLSVVAEVSNGKSTFLNALIFKDQVLHSGLGAVTARLFKINYGEKHTLTSDNKTTSYSSIEALKESVKALNETTRHKMDNKKSVSEDDIKEVDIEIPHKSLKDGITIYDTPGFGSLDESLVYPIIQQAVAKSDAVIMLLDIATGIKKGEDKFVKDVLKSIPANQRFVVFNKIDAVINEDQKILMGEDELNTQLKKVKDDTLRQLSSITKIPQAEITSYSLSASKALIGFKQNNQEKIDDSYFELFETDFWHKVINSKREVFENRITTYNALIGNCSNSVEQVKNSLQKNHTELENLKNALIERKAEFSAFSYQSTSALDSKIKEFTSDTSTVFSIDSLLENVETILQREVYEAIDEINWLDKLKVWSLKDKYADKIKEALLDSEFDVKNSVDEYFSTLMRQLYAAQNDINSTINTINEKIADFNDLGVTALENIDILEENEDGEYSLNTSANSDFSDHISLDKEVFVIVGGIIAEIIAGRLVMLIPGLGLAIAAAFAAIMKIYKTYNDPNTELARKVATSVVQGLRESLVIELNKYTSQTNEIKNAMSLALLSAKAKLNMIEQSFENPQEREETLAQLDKDIKQIEAYQTQLKTLKGSK
jgi:hypothetical protein